jgi:hypothetical protein
VTYIASPRTATDAPDRADDCEQCLTSAFLHLTRSSNHCSDPAIDATLTTAAVEAGWNEHEVLDALGRLRAIHHADSAPLQSSPLTIRDPGLVPSSSV